MRGSRLVLMALAVGAFFTAEEVFMDLAAGRTALAAGDIVDGAQFWLIWVALVPLISLAIRRWPLNDRTVAGPIAAHAGVGVALAVLHNVLSLLVDAALKHPRSGGLAVAFQRRLISQPFVWGVFTGLVFYTVVVMLYTALAFRAELAQAKLDTLRAQLRPHFLFNALNAISVFVGEDAGKARLLILRLSALLRRSLEQERDEVPLAEELGFANEYLDIQRGRFGDRLNVVFEVSPAALRGNTPVFLLQPLLENAIEHGMPDDRPITVAVRASRSADQLRLSVVDDGVGIDGLLNGRLGVGLANTRARLEQLYGRAARLEWRSAGDGRDALGTHVAIELPYRESPA